MARNNSLSIIILILLIFILVGCSSASYDYRALCIDREVIFCEDFEPKTIPLIESINLENNTDHWWITDDEDPYNLFYDFPIAGRSRANMTILGNGFYNNNSRSILYTAGIDLTDATSGALYYNLLYDTESHWDGMVVFAVTGWEGGGDYNWIMLEPQGGYPDTIEFDGTIIQGYSGFNRHWIHEEIDLSPVLGNKVAFVFYFASDYSIGGWGIALDDIVVDADTNAIVSNDGIIGDLPDLNHFFPQDPLITTNIPRATAFMDTPCEGEIPEILKESQRAFVKATNETGDRFSVLHPDSGNFCWVASEDVWIDGNDWDLPQISDKKPEDLYLPVCALRKTPIISDLACQTSGETSLPYQVHSALVENGKITTLLLDPGNGPSGDAFQEIPDPRVSGMDQLPIVSIDLRQSPGGIINLSINDTPQTCSLDKEQPGRVLCDGLSLDAGGPLQISLCWQGWDENTLCPPGFVADPAREKCQLLADLGTCAPECPDGYLYSTGEGLCLVEIKEEGKDTEFCPGGLSVNPDAECCVSSEIIDWSDCPAGYYYGLEGSSCQKLPDDGTCTDGFISQEEPGNCLPERSSSSPVCTTIEIKFTNPEVTVKESAHCWRGPGSSYENVSSLKPFTIVEVLGIGEGGEYLVIKNPKYQIPCWVKEENLYLDKLDLTILPIIPVSPSEGGSGSSQDTDPGGQ